MRWSQPSSVSGLPDALERVKSWCNLTDDNTTDDADLIGFLTAAMGVIETHQRRQLLTATYAVHLDDWPNNGEIKIGDKLPIRSIVSVQYKDADGATQTVTASNYHTSFASYHSPARIKPISGYAWPTLQTGAYDRVTINLTAGYGTANDIPPTTKAALKMLVSGYNEYRDAFIVGTTVAELPDVMQNLIGKECWGFYG